MLTARLIAGLLSAAVLGGTGYVWVSYQLFTSGLTQMGTSRPNWRMVDERLREALARVGQADVTLQYRVVATPEEAEAVGFRGSPTVLVDGRDPFLDRDSPVGLSCRVYRTEDGLAGAPTVDHLVAANQASKLCRSRETPPFRCPDPGQVPSDVGGICLLSRAPDELGTHPGLMSDRMEAAEAIYCGFADHWVPGGPSHRSAGRPGGQRRWRGARRARRPRAHQGTLAGQRAWVDACYSADTVEEILDRLNNHGSDAARAAAGRLAQLSPTALKVRLRALPEARNDAARGQPRTGTPHRRPQPVRP